MKKYGSFLAAAMIAVIALIVLTKCLGTSIKTGKDDTENNVGALVITSAAVPESVPAAAIVKPDATGHFDFGDTKVFFMGPCHLHGRDYGCLWVRNGGDTYIMVLNDNADEVFQLKKMPDGSLKQTWARGESV